MAAQNRRKTGRKRRSEAMNFAYSGPFAPLLDPAVGRALPLTEERYSADSAESYTVLDQLEDDAHALFAPFVGATDRINRKRRTRRGRRGGNRQRGVKA